MSDRGPFALVEAIDRDGQVRQAWRVERWPLAIGRAIDNDVVLSDPYVAPHHATLDAGTAPGAVALRVGAATANGVVVDGARVDAGRARELAASGDEPELLVGRTRLRLRLAGRALGPEQRLTQIDLHEPRAWPTLALLAALLGVVAFGTWLDTDPDLLPRALGSALLAALFGAAVWCGVWALLTKTFTRQSRFGWHARVFVVASLAVFALGAIPALAAFAFSWPWLADFAFVGAYAAFAVGVWFHLLAVEPARARTLRIVVASGFLSAVALSLWLNVQRTGRPGDELYMHRLFPPALRVARPVPVDRLVDGLAGEQAVLDRQAKDKGDDDGDAGEGS